MIKANDLDGRAVVDLETAKKVGYVDEIYLDTDGGRIAAYLVAEGSKLAGGGQKILMPAAFVETIGPEAIMVRATRGERVEHGAYERLPRLSHIKGRKVVSEGGKLLGTIDDVLLDDTSGHIAGYTLKSANWTDSLFGGHGDHQDYVRGDANPRLGEDLLIVPEEAVVRGRPLQEDGGTVRNHGDLDRTGPVSQAGQAGQAEHWDDVRARYRTRWEQRTTGRGGLWEEHEPGYRYGWEMANRPDFRGRTWSTAEPELRRDWEVHHHDRPWDRAVGAIRDAWDEVTGRDETDVAGYRAARHHDHDGDHDDSLDAIERLSERPAPATYRDTTPTADTERIGTRRPLL